MLDNFGAKVLKSFITTVLYMYIHVVRLIKNFEDVPHPYMTVPEKKLFWTSVLLFFQSYMQVTKAIDSLVKNDFTIPQAKAIIAKLKEQWKEVKTWSASQLKKVGKLLKDFSVEDLKSLSKEQFQVR